MFDDFFSRHRLDKDKLESYAKKNEILKIAQEISLQLGPRSGIQFVPNSVIDFISKLVSKKQVKTILDPSSSLGVDILRLKKSYPKAKALALYRNHEEHQILNELNYDTAGIEFICGDFTEYTSDHSFDLIYSFFPFNIRRNTDNRIQYERIRDTLDKLALIKYGLYLSDEGYGFFIVSPNFFFNRGQNKVISNLKKHGLYLHLALHLPSNSFPHTSIPGYLICIRKVVSEKLFVGSLTENSVDVLVQNFLEKQEGDAVELGHFVDPDTFFSLDSIIIDNQIQDYLRSKRILKEYHLNEIAKFSSPKREAPYFVEKSNCVYLPRFTIGKAVNSIHYMENKPHNYIQLAFDKKYAVSEYVSEFYNTDFGRLLRNQHSYGGVIPRISIKRMRESSIYLPPVPQQLEFVKTITKIRNIETQIKALRTKLVENPYEAEEIKKALSRFDQEETFTDWMDSLPFPLASILWNYNIQKTAEKKVEFLLFFFEALAIFNTTILLSGFFNNPHIKAEYSEIWKIGDGEYTIL